MKKGINLDTAFAKFWSEDGGVCIYRVGNATLREHEKTIERELQYAFYKGWSAMQKREAKKRKKK